MAVSFDKLEPGMILLDIHSTRMGNTTMRRLGCWKVLVLSVDKEAQTAMCSWNGNPARLYFERDFKSLRTKPSKAFLAQEERERARRADWPKSSEVK